MSPTATGYLNGTIYAEYASKDPEVQAGFAAYIAEVDPDHEHAEWWTDNVEANIYNYRWPTLSQVPPESITRA